MNVIMIAGTVGSDAELRQLPSGKSVLNWKTVVNSGWGDKKQSIWVECSLWGDRGAKLQQYITKGGKVTVYGKFSLRFYETKNGPGGCLMCDVTDVTLQGSRQQEARPEPAAAFDDKAAASAAFDDDIPF